MKKVNKRGLKEKGQKILATTSKTIMKLGKKNRTLLAGKVKPL